MDQADSCGHRSDGIGCFWHSLRYFRPLSTPRKSLKSHRGGLDCNKLDTEKTVPSTYHKSMMSLVSRWQLRESTKFGTVATMQLRIISRERSPRKVCTWNLLFKFARLPKRPRARFSTQTHIRPRTPNDCSPHREALDWSAARNQLPQKLN